MSSSLAPNQANNGSHRAITPNTPSYVASHNSDVSGGVISESEKAPKRQQNQTNVEGKTRAHRQTPPIFRRIPSDTKAFTIWIDPQLLKKPRFESSGSRNPSEWRTKATSTKLEYVYQTIGMKLTNFFFQ